MIIVYVIRKDNFPEAHVFNVFSDAISFALQVYEQEFVQSISFIYENVEVES